MYPIEGILYEAKEIDLRIKLTTMIFRLLLRVN